MNKDVKRRPPLWLQNVLKLDEDFSKKIVNWADSWAPLHSLRLHYKALEITCHGIPWLASWIAFIWLFDNPSLVPLQVNVIFALILDIVFVALLKAYFRRRRPTENINDAFAEIGPDQYSFPSGHCSRAALITFIFMGLWPIPIWFQPSLLAWTVAICISRLLMKRHNLLDVIGGILLGIVEGAILMAIWIPDEQARWFVGSITHAKEDGTELDS
ncbi:polyisoprenoid diphosphate/phosphate phosphohydrolase PLPP6 [Dendroctonus ponderosae]|uniref:polyisoprenoid diphosphate/phosphate phosphohydrolase PLPP6 n=1 Tax=Dendroctonus ponderosae TaxID=77166 RepID=UPI002034DDBC|nr:polyisoprenoid diphosphate/phosphate phosphohydrolase PLPP6 [Dendroctonus ponderosae]